MSCYVFTIDGVLANDDHRRSFAESKDWKSYYDACSGDRPREVMVDLLGFLRKSNVTILFFTERPERVRKATVDWLVTITGGKAKEFDESRLFMAKDDYTQDVATLKRDMFVALPSDMRWKVSLAYECDLEAVKMWKTFNIPCMQVYNNTAPLFTTTGSTVR